MTEMFTDNGSVRLVFVYWVVAADNAVPGGAGHGCACSHRRQWLCFGMSYTGSKSGSGVYQEIINQMPPHQVYVEAFLGSGAVMRRKRPAALNVGLDIDPEVVAAAGDIASPGAVVRPGLRLVGPVDGRPRYCFEVGDAVVWLGMLRWWSACLSSCLVYCDPPYLASTRRSRHRRLYRYELDEPGHIALLDVLVGLPCMVMVSGYESELYRDRLSSWRVVKYCAMTHAGPVCELLWCNFPDPEELHDYRYLGRGFRERERIRRRRARWVAMLAAMPGLERAGIVSELVGGI